ncbi:unnamed protein product [Parnassius apollo]|uniref:(apollo) hypothetical protein n=1 Tax=Parnassius apollo TaxID=110799 RepID=A0A8S3WGF0_PARAO|nr:unnamed protein product [Parnassius apollo]
MLVSQPYVWKFTLEIREGAQSSEAAFADEAPARIVTAQRCGNHETIVPALAGEPPACLSILRDFSAGF